MILLEELGPFVAFVETPHQGVTDNMILIQSSWIDNPIILYEAKAAPLLWDVIPARCRVICLRWWLLSSSRMPLCLILNPEMWTSLLSHIQQPCITTGSSGPHWGWWYLSVDRSIPRLWSRAWLWKFHLLVLISTSALGIPMIWCEY